MSELLSVFHSLVNVIEDDAKSIKSAIRVLRKQKSIHMQQPSTSSDHSDHLRTIERFVGPVPTELNVLPPPKAKTKGRDG